MLPLTTAHHLSAQDILTQHPTVVESWLLHPPEHLINRLFFIRVYATQKQLLASPWTRPTDDVWVQERLVPILNHDLKPELSPGLALPALNSSLPVPDKRAREKRFIYRLEEDEKIVVLDGYQRVAAAALSSQGDSAWAFDVLHPGHWSHSVRFPNTADIFHSSSAASEPCSSASHAPQKRPTQLPSATLCV